MNAAERDLRRLLRKALRAGWRLERSAGRAGHWHVRCPRGRLVAVVPHTPSDHRSTKNLIRDLRRAQCPL